MMQIMMTTSTERWLSERAGGRWVTFKKEKAMMDLGGATLHFEMRMPTVLMMEVNSEKEIMDLGGATLNIGIRIPMIP